MKTQRVENMTSDRGNKIANQFIISTYDEQGNLLTQTFQSYDSTIAIREGYNGQVTLDKYYWDYSKTTLKYLKLFLNISDSEAQIQKDIDNGVYKLDSLN